MPIYEYYSPDTHRIYSFYAKTLAQGRLTPQCPDNPKARMQRMLSTFAVGNGESHTESEVRPNASPGDDDARLDAAMQQVEGEISQLDEKDPRALARLMRRMADAAGGKLDAPMEEAVRKLEEGADPDTLEEQLGDLLDAPAPGEGSAAPTDSPSAKPRGRKKARAARPTVRRGPPTRDPKLYDYVE